MGRRKGIDYSELEEVSREISEVSKNIGLGKMLTSDIIASQFEFIRYIIQRGDFETVRLPYIGKFQASGHLLHRINKVVQHGTVPNRKRSGSAGQSGSDDDKGVQETH